MKTKSSQTYSFMEALESRIAPAGVVNATFSHGKLLLAGDALDNSLTLTQVGGGDFALTGNAGTTISLNGAAAAGSVSLTSPITSIAANMGDGIDELQIIVGTISGNISFKGGGGADTLGVSNFRAGGDLVFKGEAGDDVLTLNAANIGGGILAVMGNGDNVVAASAAHVGKSWQTTGGSGDDVLSVGLISLKGGILFDAGDGDNTFNTNSALTTGGPVKYIAGGGNDGASFDGQLVFGGKIKAELGSGANAFSLTGFDVHLAGLKVITGGGNDNVVVNGTSIENSGGFNFSLGNGNNNASVTSGVIQVDGGLSVTGGAQDDVFTLSGIGVVKGSLKANLGSGTVGQAVVINSATPAGMVVGGDLVSKISTPTGTSTASIVGVNVGGDQLIKVSGTNVSITQVLGEIGGTSTYTALGTVGVIVNLSDLDTGAVFVHTGAVNDQVHVNDIHVRGKFVVDTGAGDDIVSIEGSGATDLPSTFDAIAKIITGNGDDFLAIGDNTLTTKGIFKGNAVFNGGAGNDTANVSAALLGNQYASGPATPGFEAVN